jgi:hypothetical protein
LNRHGGPVEPVSARSDRAGLFTQVCQLQQCLTCRFFFLVAFCRAHNTFFDRSFPLLGAHIFLLAAAFWSLSAGLSSVWSLPPCGAHSVLFLHADTPFLCPVSSCACRNFFLCPVTSLARRLFFCLLPLSRTAGPVRARIFFLGVHAEARHFSLSGHFTRAQNFFWLCMQKLCHFFPVRSFTRVENLYLVTW